MTTYNSKADYYSNEGQPQAVRLFDKLGSRKHHGVSLAMTLDQLRKRLEQLPDNTPIQAALADLWLDLDQKEARRRRKDEPPPSPFVTVGKSEVAPKGEIPAWDLAWRMKRIAQEGAQLLQRSGSARVQSEATLLQKKLLWLVANGKILGWSEEVPTVAFERSFVSEVTVKAWTLFDALRKPWEDPQEQFLWTKRYAASNRQLEAEVESLTLAAQTISKTDTPPLRDL